MAMLVAYISADMNTIHISSDKQSVSYSQVILFPRQQRTYSQPSVEHNVPTATNGITTNVFKFQKKRESNQIANGCAKIVANSLLCTLCVFVAVLWFVFLLIILSGIIIMTTI